MSADLILGLDTTGRGGSASLATSSGIEVTVEWSAVQSHTINLQRAVKTLVDQADDRLVAVAVAAGPGGFSSVRSSMAFAKGLCLALDIKLVTVESLVALAGSLPLMERPRVVAALDAGRDALFAGEFLLEGLVATPVGETALVSVAELVAMTGEGAVLAGYFDEDRRRELEEVAAGSGTLTFTDVARPLAEAVAMAGWSKIGETSDREVRTAIPAYLRAPAATLPSRGWGRA